jgi:hypothetical protein
VVIILIFLDVKDWIKISKVCPKKVEKVNIHKASVYVQIVNSYSQEWFNMYVCRISNYWAVGLDGNIVI